MNSVEEYLIKKTLREYDRLSKTNRGLKTHEKVLARDLLTDAKSGGIDVSEFADFEEYLIKFPT